MDLKFTAHETASRLLQEAKNVRSQLADETLKLSVTALPGTHDNRGTTTSHMVLTINSATAELAFKYAERLKEIEPKCNCVSSGETEITCTCPG